MSFEGDARGSLRRTRRDRRSDDATVVGYEDESGRTRQLTGDAVAPYAHALGRASADGAAGTTEAENGKAQRILTDNRGRVWTLPAPAPTVAGVLVEEGEAPAGSLISDPIDVSAYRRLTLYLQYEAGADGAAMSVVPLAGADENPPTGLSDGYFLTALDAGTFGTSMSEHVLYGTVYKFPATTPPERFTRALSFDVSGYRWVVLAYGSDNGTPVGTFGARYNLSQ